MTLLVIKLDYADIRRLLELVLANTVVHPDSISEEFVSAVASDMIKRHTTDGTTLKFEFLLWISNHLRNYISIFRAIDHNGQSVNEYYRLINEITEDVNKK